MAIPVVASVGSVASGTGTSITTNAPSGVAVGDLLDLRVAIVTGTPSIDTPSGWTLIASVSDGVGVRTAAYWRIADGTATDTPTVSITGGSVTYRAYILRITGAGTSQPETSSTGNGTSASPPIPSVTTGSTDELLVTSMATSANSFSVAAPSTWTNVATFGGVPPAFAINRKDASSAGAYGGETYSSSGGTYAGITVAYSPGAPSTDLMQGGSCGV